MKKTLWTVDLLRADLETVSDPGTRRRIADLLDLSLEAKLLQPSVTTRPAFGLGAHPTRRAFSVWGNAAVPWERFAWFFEPEVYPGGREQRDAILQRLESLELPMLPRWRERKSCTDIAILGALREWQFEGLKQTILTLADRPR